MLSQAGTAAGGRELSRGAGGDVTVELDRRAEAEAVAVLERLHDAGARFSLLSEEVGRRDFGAPSPLVVLDPVDGSLNAAQGIPVFAVMLSLVAGERLGDVTVGYVMNLATGQRWHALRGGGAFLDDRPLTVLDSAWTGRVECLGLESSPRSLGLAGPLVQRAGKIRILGSMALSLCHTASGGLDVFCCPIQGRLFDMSASLLVLREAGGVATDMQGGELEALPVDLNSRTTLLAASNRDVHAQALALLRAEAGRA